MFDCFLVLPACALKKRAKKVTSCLVFNSMANVGVKQMEQRRIPCLAQQRTQAVSWTMFIQATKSVA